MNRLQKLKFLEILIQFLKMFSNKLLPKLKFTKMKSKNIWIFHKNQKLKDNSNNFPMAFKQTKKKSLRFHKANKTINKNLSQRHKNMNKIHRL